MGLPRSLNTQIILLVTGILLATGASSGWLSARQQSHALLAIMRENSAVMARSFAENAAHNLVLQDYAGLESFLLKSAERSDIARLEVCEADGSVVGHIEHVPGMKPRALADLGRMTPPSPPGTSITLGKDTMVIWEPITAGNLLGWIRVTYSMATIREVQAKALRNNISLALLWLACSIALLLIMLRPMVQAIGRLTAFARSLDEHKGARIDPGYGTIEIEELGSSLNYASSKLFATEQQLIHERERLHVTLRSIQDGVIATDGMGTVVFMNRSSEALTGWTAAEAAGKKVEEVLHLGPSPSPGGAESCLAALNSGSAVELEPETTLVAKNGKERFVAGSLAPIRDDGGNLSGMVLVFRDITARKQAEEDIKRLNERFTLATNAAHLGIWDWDIKNNELVWDDGMYALYGCQRKDIATAYEAWLQGLHPEDRAASDELSRLARLGECEYDTEFRVVWPDGSIHCLKAYGQVVKDADGTPLRMTGINYDITDRKRAEDEIRTLNAELEQRVIARTAELEEKNRELERFNKLFVHRELRMIELKEKIKNLEKQVGRGEV